MSSRNASPWGGALLDDTKNGCVADHVYKNPDKNMLFKTCPVSRGHGIFVPVPVH